MEILFPLLYVLLFNEILVVRDIEASSFCYKRIVWRKLNMDYCNEDVLVSKTLFWRVKETFKFH